MPIRPEYRWLYPIDWVQLSALIRFERAKGRCQGCGRPHGRMVCHLGDGRWWDPERAVWRDGAGRRVRRALEIDDLQVQVRTTRVVLEAEAAVQGSAAPRARCQAFCLPASP